MIFDVSLDTSKFTLKARLRGQRKRKLRVTLSSASLNLAFKGNFDLSKEA